jgi:AcrR family transcriptional regulator
VARPRSDIAPRIVHAARQRFLSEGVDGASLRAIARDAGTSIGMVYYYFPSKDDLFLAVVEEVYVALLEELESALARSIPVVERVRRLYERLGALSDVERHVVRLVLREVLASPARLARLVRRFQSGHIPLLRGLVEDGVATGLFRDDLPAGLLLAALGALAGPAQVGLTLLEGRPAPKATQSRADALVEVLLHGIAARPAAHRRS